MRLALIIFCFWATAANAGAWLREPGTGFFALSGTVNDRMESATSIYLEYGLRERLTLGADLNLVMRTDATISGGGLVFARLPLADGTWTSSWLVALGGREQTGEIHPFASLGYSIGRGVTWHKGGWVNLDLRLDMGSRAVSQLKIDGTVGLQIAERSKAMLQVYLTVKEGGTLETTLAPSIVFDPGDSKPAWQIGIEAKEAELGFKLGLWRTF